jgi:hypothetical protein
MVAAVASAPPAGAAARDPPERRPAVLPQVPGE